MVKDNKDFLEGGGDDVNFNVKLIIIFIPLSTKIFITTY